MYKIQCNKKFEMELDTPNFINRYEKLNNSNNKHKIIYIKNEFDNSTFRYRCYNFEQALQNSEYEIIYFLTDEIERILKDIKKVNIIIFQRTSYTIAVENLIYLAKLNNIKIGYDMDDLLYKIDYVPSFINNIGYEFTEEHINTYLQIASKYELVANKCDFYLTTTEYLKEKLSEDFKKPVFLIPNFLNIEQISESLKINKLKKEHKDKFIIGYFSGSPSHRNDFRKVENDLVRLLDTYSNIYIKIVGFMELTPKLKEYENKKRVIFKPLVPYIELQYEIAEVDVNIIPLVNNNFNNSKSELKFFEAGILKIASCISPTSVYKKIIKNGINGIFCKDGDWFKKIEYLYLNPKENKRIGEEAYKITNNIYLPEKQRNNIEETYRQIEKL